MSKTHLTSAFLAGLAGGAAVVVVDRLAKRAHERTGAPGARPKPVQAQSSDRVPESQPQHKMLAGWSAERAARIAAKPRCGLKSSSTGKPCRRPTPCPYHPEATNEGQDYPATNSPPPAPPPDAPMLELRKPYAISPLRVSAPVEPPQAEVDEPTEVLPVIEPLANAPPAPSAASAEAADKPRCGHCGAASSFVTERLPMESGSYEYVVRCRLCSRVKKA